jgi:hypothetical protein
MLRKILAWVVVAAFFVGCSFALSSASVGPLTYLPVKAEGQQVVKLFLENTQGLAVASIPISYGEPGSDIICTKVSFEGSRVEHFIHYVQKDNENKKVLIAAIRALNEEIRDQLPPGEGLFATLTFESKTGIKPQLCVTNWQLTGGKLYFHMVDASAKGFYYERIENQQDDHPIPLRQGTSSEEESAVSLPSEFNLQQNYPNPFNPETIIKFSLPQDSWVTLKVFNLLGQVVITLVDEQKAAGEYTVSWNGKNGQNQDVSSGVYFYRIKAGDHESVRSMTLLR